VTVPGLNAARRKCLAEVCAAPAGLKLYPGPGFFCSGSTSLHGTVFRFLAGYGLINVIDTKILITDAGRAILAAAS
jgi:hypothetical protein